MTPSEEMIPRRLRFKIASHGRTADWANQLFKFGGWNRVAESCRELGRFKKDQKKAGPRCGYHNRLWLTNGLMEGLVGGRRAACSVTRAAPGFPDAGYRLDMKDTTP